jgi:hypothetical protein
MPHLFEVTGSQAKTISFCVSFTVRFLEMGFLKLWHRIFNVVTLATVMIAFHIGGCIQQVTVRQEANTIIGDQLFIFTHNKGHCTQDTRHYDGFVTVTAYVMLHHSLFYQI